MEIAAYGRLFPLVHLDKNEKFCYTYDVLNRVTARTVKNATTGAFVSRETFSYDAAGNIAEGSDDSILEYDVYNKLVKYDCKRVNYDLDGNMLSNGSLSCMYDSANRLLYAGGNAYSYNAEDVRIKNIQYGVEEQYTYHTNCKLSKMLMRTVGTTVTKYVYGHGLISEETNNTVKVYHFDYRGSTVAITDVNGNISDTFEYDTYGLLTSRTGTSDIIFCYNGRDGVVTDKNGLLYMRARYYSPDMRRFVNADILHGKISDSTSLNRYSYVNGNPVSFVDPFGLASERGHSPTPREAAYMAKHIYGATEDDINKKINNGEYLGLHSWRLESIIENKQGLKIGVYYYVDLDGVISYAIVNAGSTLDVFNDLDGVYNDWINNNLTQPFGNSLDMKDSIAFAQEFVKEHSGCNITFIGHSKGGAEAAANAVATNRNAILFNPATVNLNAYGLDSSNYSANMIAYIVEGEVLSDIFGPISAPIDEVEYLNSFFCSSEMDLFAGPLFGFVLSVIKHSMDTVIELLPTY